MIKLTDILEGTCGYNIDAKTGKKLNTQMKTQAIQYLLSLKLKKI